MHAPKNSKNWVIAIVHLIVVSYSMNVVVTVGHFVPNGGAWGWSTVGHPDDLKVHPSYRSGADSPSQATVPTKTIGCTGIRAWRVHVRGECADGTRSSTTWRWLLEIATRVLKAHLEDSHSDLRTVESPGVVELASGLPQLIYCFSFLADNATRLEGLLCVPQANSSEPRPVSPLYVEEGLDFGLNPLTRSPRSLFRCHGTLWTGGVRGHAVAQAMRGVNGYHAP